MDALRERANLEFTPTGHERRNDIRAWDNILFLASLFNQVEGPLNGACARQITGGDRCQTATSAVSDAARPVR